MNLSVTRSSSIKHNNSKGFRAQRVYDYLYDPVHTVSSEADHARCSFKSYASVGRPRRVADFESMFSHLPHPSRYGPQPNPLPPLPAFVDRRWRGPDGPQRGHTLQGLTGVKSPIRGQDCDVTAADRWKFFRRPNIPFDHCLPPDVMFAPASLTAPPAEEEGSDRRGVQQRTVGIQTDYRDSQVQTDPYSPEYVVRPGTAHPELLRLASLTWGGGLPAGLAEVEMIQRARAKRAWEASLPPLGDLKQLDKRRRMMEAMETREWAFREGQIQKLQEARLAVLRDLLTQRDLVQTRATAQRLDHDLTQHQRDRESRLRKIHRDFVLSLRKLTAKRVNVEERFERRDIVRDHTDRSSETYAPLTRSGPVPDHSLSRARAVRSRFLNTYQGLLDLEASLPASVLEPRIEAPKARSSAGRSARRELELIQTHQALKEAKAPAGQRKPLRFLLNKERPAPRRPPTPRLDTPPEGEEEKELATINLQRLLRGRSIQYQMFAGKERHLALIRELRTTHALLGEDQDLLKAQSELVLSQKHQRDLQRHQAAEEQAFRDGLAGAELVDLLDTLSKELIRQQEERRIHAVVLLAERERRLREAEESGRRQVEERRRREHDEIFRQVVKVHQATVDLYLEDVLLASMEQTAEEQAREEVRRMAREVNDAAYAMEESRSELQSEEMVSELVYSFLLPEVRRISVRQEVRRRQQRHLQAAQLLLHEAAGSPGVPPAPDPAHAPVQSPGSGSAETPVGLGSPQEDGSTEDQIPE